MNTISVNGSISVQEILGALKKAYPGREFAEANVRTPSMSDSLLLVYDTTQETAAFEKELTESEKARNKTLLALQAMQKQQKQLFDEFVTLRQKYDDTKLIVSDLLWNHLRKHHPELQNIPTILEGDVDESDEKIGNVMMGEQLGEGQYAVVRDCTRVGQQGHFAIKIINKEKVQTFTNLQRIANELSNLAALKHPNVIDCMEIVHTETKLYILSEKCGLDLFDFFDYYPTGMPESAMKDIMSGILKGTMFCHEQHICHRGEWWLIDSWVFVCMHRKSIMHLLISY
jgi:hypothetical protein